MVSRRKRASSSSPSDVISTPRTVMSPAVGRSRPAMRPSRVDFPLPEGPAMATNCRAGTSSVMSVSTSTGRPPLSRRMESPRTVIMMQPYYTSGMRRLWAVALLAVSVASLSAARLSAGEPHVIVAFGDSLTAGLGVRPEESYPSRLEARLRAAGYDYRVVNAGVSGDTTAGGLRRVDWALRAHPDIVIVALGANDGLRGQSPQAIRANLEEIVARLQASGARVLLVGMRLPPNYGAEYTKEFEAVFPAVARRAKIALMPFLLDGVAADPRLNQADGIHPTAAGQQMIADRLWPYLRPLLRPVK